MTFQIYGKIKHVPIHQPDDVTFKSLDFVIEDVHDDMKEEEGLRKKDLQEAGTQ